MRKPERRPLSLLLAVVLCLSALAFPTFAAYESDESGGTEPPEYIGSVITITSEEMGDMPELPEGGETLAEPESEQPEGMDMDAFFESLFALLLSGDALTPEGNMTLVDDIVQGNGTDGKQFLTVTTKNGNYFYLVIDRSGEKENVHFLNQVDEADLMALLEDGDAEVKPASCTCRDRCYAGHVDTSCPICAVNMTECTGKQPEPTPAPAVETTQEPDAAAKKSAPGKALFLLIVVLCGGAAFYFLKVRGKGLPFGKQKPNGGSFREEENEEADDEFMEFEKSEEADIETATEAEDPEDTPVPFFPDDGEYWPEDEKDGSAK